jgi:hypothetical protein
MTQIDFNNFITFLKENKIFPPILLNDPIWQKNSRLFLSTFEKFLRTDKGKEYLKNLTEGKITIVEGNTIPTTESNCSECVKKEDLKSIQNTVVKVNPFEQILRGEYKK